MTINTDFLDRCIETLEAAFEQLSSISVATSSTMSSARLA